MYNSIFLCFFMFKRFLLLLFFIFIWTGIFFFFENGGNFVSNNSSQSWKVYNSIQHRLNTPSFSAYKWCSWTWKTMKNVGVWIQECSVKWKKVSLVANEEANGFYYAVDSWKWYEPQSLAIQIFDYDGIFTPDELLDKIYVNLLKNWFLKLESLCEFVPDEKVHSNLWPAFHLVSKTKHLSKESLCWEYGDSSLYHRYFIVTKEEKSKIFFINQVQKNIFDIQSLKILQ